MAVRVAINGFGRTGRAAFRAAYDRQADIEWVAINDVAEPAMLAQLLRHDTVYGPFQGTVEPADGAIVVDGKTIPVPGETDPASLPWGELGAEVVIESTGRFRTRADAEKHLEAGAGKLIISAPAKDPDVTVALGVNFDDAYDPEVHRIISNASCTTNCLAPVAKLLHEHLGIRHGLMTRCMPTRATSSFWTVRTRTTAEPGPRHAISCPPAPAPRRRWAWSCPSSRTSFTATPSVSRSRPARLSI
jgi:glyceraldehyde 3-phosphate dehydrogenase